MYQYLAAALAFLVVGFGSGWEVQKWRMESNEKHRIEAAATQERELYAMEQKRSSNVIDAQSAARKRETGLRTDAAAASDELERLRSQSTAALLAASTSLDACNSLGNTHSELLLNCSKQYAAMASEADQWVSDVKTLTEAWPK